MHMSFNGEEHMHISIRLVCIKVLKALKLESA
jgi:hypothetical protein